MSFIPGRLYTIYPRLLSQVYNMWRRLTKTPLAATVQLIYDHGAQLRWRSSRRGGFVNTTLGRPAGVTLDRSTAEN